MNKTHILGIRVTENQFQVLKQLAAAEGLNVSQYVTIYLKKLFFDDDDSQKLENNVTAA